jgi:hypothetical protein
LINLAALRQTSLQGTKPCRVGFPCPAKFIFEIHPKWVFGCRHKIFPLFNDRTRRRTLRGDILYSISAVRFAATSFLQ